MRTERRGSPEDRQVAALATVQSDNRAAHEAGPLRRHEDDHVGCCPTVGVTATADSSKSEIALAYKIGPDPCECICNVSIDYTLSGVPDGKWTLVHPDVTTAVTVK